MPEAFGIDKKQPNNAIAARLGTYNLLGLQSKRKSGNIPVRHDSELYLSISLQTIDRRRCKSLRLVASGLSQVDDKLNL